METGYKYSFFRKGLSNVKGQTVQIGAGNHRIEGIQPLSQAFQQACRMNRVAEVLPFDFFRHGSLASEDGLNRIQMLRSVMRIDPKAMYGDALYLNGAFRQVVGPSALRLGAGRED